MTDDSRLMINVAARPREPVSRISIVARGAAMKAGSGETAPPSHARI